IFHASHGQTTMTTQSLLTSLFQYKAWANDRLLAAMDALDGETLQAERHAAILILNHAHIVDRIFAANLQKLAHGYSDNEPAQAPALDALSASVRDTDRWYVDYTARLSPDELVEVIAFTFTDGAPGRMSREQMLGHVIAHGGYHRGQVGQILSQMPIALRRESVFRDTFTSYLHRPDAAAAVG
ncbi:MAG TPA: DinB family protein, partial [Inquilinus sp.]